MPKYRRSLFIKRIRWWTAPLVKRCFPETFIMRIQKLAKDLPKYPLLRMILNDLNNLPPFELPKDFQYKNLNHGNEEEFIKVMNHTFRKGLERDWFFNCFARDPEFDPKNFFIIRTKNKEPIAACAAWQTELKGSKIGLLEKLGVVENYQGRGLGRAIFLLCLHRLKERGFQEAMLFTEDFRIPAIRLFLSLGFKPLYDDKLNRNRWKKVMIKISNFKKKENAFF